MRVLLGVIAPGRNINQVHAAIGQDDGETDRVLDLPALHVLFLLEPIGGADPEEQGHILGHQLAREVDNLQRQARAVLEAAAVLVGALVGRGGDEGVQEVAVGVVDLEHVEANVEGALDGRRPVFLELLNVLLRHLLDRGVFLVPGDWTGAVHVVGPAVDILGRDLAGADPRSNGGGFSSGVCNLQADFLPLAVSEVDNPLQRFLLRVFPQTTVFGCDAPFWVDRSRLDHGEAGSTLNDTAEMSQVPIGLVTILRRVLA